MNIKKFLIGASASAVMFGAMAVPALAAKPANQACLGEDVSGYAQGGSAFGGFVSTIASSIGGVGEDIQNHLAGLVPDGVIPNTCND